MIIERTEIKRELVPSAFIVDDCSTCSIHRMLPGCCIDIYKCHIALLYIYSMQVFLSDAKIMAGECLIDFFFIDVQFAMVHIFIMLKLYISNVFFNFIVYLLI